MHMHATRGKLALLLSLLMMASGVGAQQPTLVDRSTIDQRLADDAQRVQADRDAIRRVLERQQLRDIAKQMKIDLARVQSAVATLDGRELTDVAARARAVDRALEGGGSVTISTTMIIIGLLVIILLIVALR